VALTVRPRASLGERVADPPADPSTEYVVIARSLIPQDGTWSVSDFADLPLPWVQMNPFDAAIPAQGWKLHISATVKSAEEVLLRAIPILVAQHCPFKFARGRRAVADLNEGKVGLSQIGKFITVYPNDDRHAVVLAQLLDEATARLEGPQIPSDFSLRPNGLVHYRYGGFRLNTTIVATGEAISTIVSERGELIPDRRLPFPHRPSWIDDPFVRAGIVTKSSDRSPLINGRFLVTATLSQSPRGAVHTSVDIDLAQRCVVKQGRRQALARLDGLDARDRLRHEAAVLEDLRGIRHVPGLIAVVTTADDDDVFLAMSELAGRTLDATIRERAVDGRLFAPSEIAEFGSHLARLVGEIHDRGYVHRDLKPRNVIVTADLTPQICDFDAAARAESVGSLYVLGTLGYMSPQQADGEPPRFSDDVYSLGAVLYSMATGMDLAEAPNGMSPLNRPMQLLNPRIPGTIAGAIERALAYDPAERPNSAAAFAEMLSDTAWASLVVAERVPAPTTELSETSVGTALKALANRLTGIVATVPDMRRPTTVPHRDIYGGRAGLLLALVELAHCLDADELTHAIRVESVRLLAEPLESRVSAGLYTGEMGVSVALLQAGRKLRDEMLIQAAEERSFALKNQPFESCDLINGAAGRARAHLAMWAATAAPRQLASATAAGEWLLQNAEPALDSGDALAWRTEQVGRRDVGRRSPGYGHGAAGIADVLLDLYEATGRDEYLRASRGATRWIESLALPALSDDSGSAWPRFEGDERGVLTWCYGAAGIGRMLLRSAAANLTDSGTELAERAGTAVAAGTRWMGMTQCHGLAGSLELLLDLGAATKDSRWLLESAAFVSLLHDFVRTIDDDVSLSLMEGLAGAAVAVQRALIPWRPHILSPTALYADDASAREFTQLRAAPNIKSR
jgi:serine/threonine protein kinase